VAVRPLRPATDRSLGEPLPHQLANRTRAPLQALGLATPALISARSKAGCHAVLASLSGRYPPLEGRSPTCYSPVCHSTYPLRGFRVRLACVRHAASVDSEPGSNSHVKFAVRPSARKRGGRSNSLTRGRFGSALFQFFCHSWFAASRKIRTGDLVDRLRDATC
jgi:hypothetical protein